MSIRSFPRLLALFVASLASVLAVPAHAAVPADVTTAITAAGTDVATLGAAVLVVFVGIKVFKWLRRAL